MADGIVNFGLIQPEASNAFLRNLQGAQDRQQVLAQQERQNKLADLQFRAAQRGEEEAMAEREAYKAGGSLGDVSQRMMQSGLGKQSLALQKQEQEQRTARINQAKEALTLMKSSAASILADPNPVTAKQKLIQLGQLTGQDLSGDLAQLESYGNDPVQIKRWAAGYAMEADKLLPRFETQNLGGTSERQGFDPLTGAPVGPAQVTKRTATPDAVMADARARQKMAQDERQFGISQANKGVAGAVPLKPLTEAQTIKLRTDVGKDYKSATTALSQMDDLLTSIQQVKTAPGLSAATGYIGKYLPSRPEGAAAQAETRLANLRGKVTALGKATAAMSGSIGSIANQEWKILADQIAVLDEVKGKGPLLEQIDLLESQAKGAAERIRDAYEKTRAEDFERFPQFRDLPKSKAPGAPAAASPNIDALLNKYK